MLLTRKIKPLPPTNQSHCTKERVRDKNVKLPHMVIMVMVVCLFLLCGRDLQKAPNNFFQVWLILFEFPGCLVVVGEHLCGRGKM